MLGRREAILATLFGTGLVGLRALATGLPASLVLNPRKALAGTASSVANDKAQFVIFNTSGAGDPINASVPGTYEDPNIVHSADAKMAPGTLSLGGRTYTAARPWTTLPREVLDRTSFWHIMTNTPIHPDEPEVRPAARGQPAGDPRPGRWEDSASLPGERRGRLAGDEDPGSRRPLRPGDGDRGPVRRRREDRPRESGRGRAVGRE